MDTLVSTPHFSATCVRGARQRLRAQGKRAERATPKVGEPSKRFGRALKGCEKTQPDRHPRKPYSARGRLSCGRWRRRADSNRRVKVLQTSPLATWVRRPEPTPIIRHKGRVVQTEKSRREVRFRSSPRACPGGSLPWAADYRERNGGSVRTAASLGRRGCKRKANSAGYVNGFPSSLGRVIRKSFPTAVRESARISLTGLLHKHAVDKPRTSQ